MSELSRERREALAVALVEHEIGPYRVTKGRGWMVPCDCGAEIPEEQAAQHQAEAIAPLVARSLAEERAGAWEAAHDVFCPRGRACSTHGKPGDRGRIYDRGQA